MGIKWGVLTTEIGGLKSSWWIALGWFGMLRGESYILCSTQGVLSVRLWADACRGRCDGDILD